MVKSSGRRPTSWLVMDMIRDISSSVAANIRCQVAKRDASDGTTVSTCIYPTRDQIWSRISHRAPLWTTSRPSGVMRASALEGITPSRAHDFLNLLRDLIELLTGVRPIRFLSYCTAVGRKEEEVRFREAYFCVFVFLSHLKSGSCCVWWHH